MTDTKPEYETYLILKDGNLINIKVVKEYHLLVNDDDDYDDVIGPYLDALRNEESNFRKFKENWKKGSLRIFKVLLEDDKIINERKENWIEQNCKKDDDPRCNAIKRGEIRLPQFNMDILVVNKNDVFDDDDDDNAFEAKLRAILPPQQKKGGNRRRRKSKRKSKNNRKKTNRRR
jgi:hypothetical protein